MKFVPVQSHQEVLDFLEALLDCLPNEAVDLLTNAGPEVLAKANEVRYVDIEIVKAEIHEVEN